MKILGYITLKPRDDQAYSGFRGEIAKIDAEPHVMAVARKLFGDHAKTRREAGRLTHKVLTMALNGATAKDLLWFSDRYPMDMSTDHLSHLREMAEEYDRILNSVAEADNDPVQRLSSQAAIPAVALRDHQIRFVNMASKVGRMLLADVMGLGKTIGGLGTLTEPQSRPAIVVCPPHLCRQWMREIKRVYPTFTTHLISGFKNYVLPEVDVLVTSYNRLAPWQDVLIPRAFSTAIFDEVHDLRKTSTGKRDAAAAISSKASRVFGLSGTPIFNYGIELHSVLDVISPGCLGTEDDFASEWCVDDKVREPAVLNSYLKSRGLMLRRTPEEVGFNFGQASKHFYTLDSDLETLKSVQDTMRALALSILSVPLNEAAEYARDFDWKLRHATGVAKAKPVAQFVRMMAEQGEKVVLAGWHRDIYDIWNQELVHLNPVMFTGTESPKEKDEAVRKFLEDDSCMVFIISLRSGAGLDGLQRVSRSVVFGELDWSPHVMDQVLKRVDRDGQMHHPQGFYLAITDGSDPFIMSILNAKRSQHDGLIEGQDAEASIIEGSARDPERIREMAKAYLTGLGEEIPITVVESGTLSQVADALRRIKVPTNTEEEMQEALSSILPGMLPEATVTREFRVGPRSRLDFLVEGVGERIAVELKATAQDRQAVYRQVRKYVKEAKVSSVVLFCPWFGIPSFMVDDTPVVIIDCTKNSV